MPAVGNSEELTLDAAHNGITADWENRYVLITYIVNAQTYEKSFPYQLGGFIPLTATAEGVRSLIGLDQQELPDRDIDLIGAYHDLLDEYGTSVSDAVVATGTKNRDINRAVTAKAALGIVESIEMRTRIQIRTENTTVVRSERIDFEKLANAIRGRLRSAMDEVTDNLSTTAALFVVSSPTDIVTG